MKKIALTIAAASILSACTTTQYVEKECPSCNPPVRHFEVVTECSEYRDTPLGGNRFAQCRYCTNKIYSDGVDVTAQFTGTPVKPMRRHKAPCRR